MSKKEPIQLLYSIDLEKSLSDLSLFCENIPAAAKLFGVKKFLELMGFTDPQYRRRLANPQLWTPEELRKVKALLLDFREKMKSISL